MTFKSEIKFQDNLRWNDRRMIEEINELKFI